MVWLFPVTRQLSGLFHLLLLLFTPEPDLSWETLKAVSTVETQASPRPLSLLSLPLYVRGALTMKRHIEVLWCLRICISVFPIGLKGPFEKR